MIGFGEYYCYRYSVGSGVVYEVDVDVLWLQSCVNKYEKACERFALVDVTLHDVSYLVYYFFAPFGVSVSWQIDKIPALVDDEMVYQQCLSWL